MLHRLKTFRIPFLVYGIILISSLIILFIWGKKDIHIFINMHHSPTADLFFKYFTHLGDGIFVAVIAVLLLFVSFRYSLMQLVAGVSCGFIAQFFKRMVFPDAPRPAKFFEDEYVLYFVEGVTIHKSFSFPSGHTATAFAIFFTLIFITKNRYLQLTYLLAAILVGYSRMYLSLHFLPDVLVGSLIGLAAALLALGTFGWSDKKWLDKRIHF